MVIDKDENYNSFQNYFINLFKREKGFTTRPKYLKKLVEKGYVNNLDAEKLKLLLPIVKALDNWGDWSFNFKLNKRSVTFLGFVIYYKELTVTNSKKEEEKIRDNFCILFVNFEETRAFVFKFQLMRTTFTLKQLIKNNDSIYLSSHYNVSKKPVFNFQLFYDSNSQSVCYGGNEEYVFSPSATTTEDFLYLFNVIKGHITWESLDGGPYYKIAKLENSFLKNSFGTFNYNSATSALRAYKNKFKDIFVFLLSKNIFFYKNDTLRIKLSESLIEQIFLEFLEADSTFLVNSSGQSKQQYLEYLENYNNLYSNDISLLNFKDKEHHKPNLYYLFQDQPFYIRVKDKINKNRTKIESNEIFFITPYLKQILTYTLDKYVSKHIQEQRIDSFRETNISKTF